MSKTMHTTWQSPDKDFWSDTYCGRPIAILNRSGRWQVYLDQVLQHNTEFATAKHAIAWLTARIDERFNAKDFRGRAQGIGTHEHSCA